jgi:hypothetical protein
VIKDKTIDATNNRIGKNLLKALNNNRITGRLVNPSLLANFKWFCSMRSPTDLICLYAETEALKYFVSKNTEYYLKYGCNLDGLVLCFIGEDTYPYVITITNE